MGCCASPLAFVSLYINYISLDGRTRDFHVIIDYVQSRTCSVGTSLVLDIVSNVSVPKNRILDILCGTQYAPHPPLPPLCGKVGPRTPPSRHSFVVYNTTPYVQRGKRSELDSCRVPDDFARHIAMVRTTATSVRLRAF